MGLHVNGQCIIPHASTIVETMATIIVGNTNCKADGQASWQEASAAPIMLLKNFHYSMQMRAIWWPLTWPARSARQLILLTLENKLAFFENGFTSVNPYIEFAAQLVTCGFGRKVW